MGEVSAPVRWLWGLRRLGARRTLYGTQRLRALCGLRCLRVVRRLLGLGVLDRPAETDKYTPGFWLDCGNGQQIHISSEANPESYNLPSKRHTAFQVSNLPGLKADLEAAGFPVEIQSQQFAGMRRIFARDPWGNGLELVEYL